MTHATFSLESAAVAPQLPAWGWAESSSLALAAACYAVFIGRTAFRLDGRVAFSLFDDAMISMRFARNLAEGHGLVWNADGERVEGFSNLLWTLWMAAPHLAGLPVETVSLAVMVSGAVCLLGVAVVMRSIAIELGLGRLYALLAMVLASFSYPLAFWTLRGMEIGLLTLAISLLILACLRLARTSASSGRWLVVATASAPLALLTRQDAVPVVFVSLAWLALQPRAARSSWALPAVASVAAFVGQELFRHWYYGAWVPNTYVLKLEGIRLVTRLDRGGEALATVVASSLWLLLILASVALLSARLEVRSRRSLLAAVVLVTSCYSVCVGGDAWEWYGFANRYLSVMLPALSVLAVVGLRALIQGVHRPLLAFALVAAATVSGFTALEAGAPIDGRQLAGTSFQPLPLVFAATLVLLSGIRTSRISPLGRGVVNGMLVGVILLASIGLGGWIKGAADLRFDVGNARLGMILRGVVPPDTTIAVSTAGAIPYFSRLPAIDELGKSDAVIARVQPSGPFLPGHNKSDLSYSIGRLQPEIVVEFYRSPTLSSMRRWGYSCVGSMFVSRDAAVDRAEIARIRPQLASRGALSCE